MIFNIVVIQLSITKALGMTYFSIQFFENENIDLYQQEVNHAKYTSTSVCIL